MKIPTVLACFDRSHKNFRHNLKAMVDANALAVPIEGVWNVKDLVGHLTAWEKLFLLPLQALTEGEAFIPDIVVNHDEFNMQQSTNRQFMTLDQVISESDNIHLEIKKAIALLTEEQCQQVFQAPWGSWETLVQQLDGLRWHADEHARCMQRWLSQILGSTPVE